MNFFTIVLSTHRDNRLIHRYVKQLGMVSLVILAATMDLFSSTPDNIQTIDQVEIRLELKNESLLNAIRKIEEQSSFEFMYRNEDVKDIVSLNISASKQSVKTILDAILTNSSLSYKQSNQRILIFKEIQESNVNNLGNVETVPFPHLSDPQELIVSGKVVDENGVGLPGVTVIVKDTTIGTVTDVEGNYSITVPNDEDILVFSFIGYIQQEVPVNGRTLIDVAMAEDVKSLEEVVVIGYGTQKKSDLTGSVASVSMDERKFQPTTNLSQALSGAAAGVNIQGTGRAGREPDMSIRGQTSLSASDRPLIVIDGIIYNGELADINTSDVESIDILKDASAAAVYGSRSANGVMLITTKKGKTDKPVLSFNMYYGLQDMTNSPMKVMNAEQYATRLVDYYYQQDLYQWYYTNPTSPDGRPARPEITDREVVASRLRTQEERDNYLAGNEIDWVDEITQLGKIQNYDLSLSQQNERSNYFVSGSYTNEEGILLNDNFKRLTLRANIESKITDWLTFGLNSSYSYRDYSGLEASLWNARRGSPLANNKIGSPNYDMFLTGEAYMPYPLNNLYVDNSDISNNLFLVGRARVTVPWIKGLTYELNYSNTYTNSNNNTFYPASTPEGAGNKGQAIKNPYEERSWIVNNIATYLKTFGDHQINATLLYSRENRQANGSTLITSGFDNPVLGYNNMGLGTLPVLASEAWEENSLSYMSRVSYTFKDRYLLTGTVRKDGFSGFAADRKFATFPSVSLGWIVSDESFFSNFNSIFLKLRTSYGKNGNQGIGRYSSFSRMAPAPYVYGSATAIGVYPNILGNAELGWETTSSVNIGIDFGFLNRRISGSIDAYTAKTTNVLVNRALPPATGFRDVWANIGAIDNKGIEFELATVNLEGRLRWGSNFVFSLNRSKITKLYGGENDKDIGNSWFVGEPISAIYDYEMAGGLWTEEDLFSGNILENWYPGQYKYVDQNGDGIIDPNEDRTIIGYEAPNFRFSINNTLSYKNFSFRFFINSIQGGNGFYLMDNSSVVNVAWNADDVYRINASAVRPYWTPDNGVNNSTGVYNTPVRRSGIYESRSFVRLQDVSLAYTLGTNLLSKLKLERCQVYLASRNPYTWTNWSGWDPETGARNQENGGDIPLMRNITAGVRLGF